ncbi:methionine ABC transporter ATP-binding protein [Occultella gossypii]|uniref:ATP-binding cassette domain-containing protein n=1 Tax=Occultella gossypii TaxID=2800820 RepID=A0ABS7SDK9_9MICO|nr:methionine ABC transporter ATP-binding protein [Occultella gossypii]MBZ2198147.1 ATP-binding cassette domain-containing protein [Occultella gossypii]
MITLQDLRKVYQTRSGEVVALDGISLEIPQGQIHGIVGQSGAGKSTLIRCLTALERPTTGSVIVDGAEVSALSEALLRQARRRIGMVFQHVNLFEARTAAANIAYPLAIAGVPRAQRAIRVQELLDLVGLGDRGDAYPAQLSGGQKQRVGIARALATEPAVLLCDEPTSALDSTTTRQILRLIRDVRDRLGITVVIITHETSVVREVCDAATLLADGRIVESGPLADVVTRPGSPLSQALVPVPDVGVGDQRALVQVSAGGAQAQIAHALHAIATEPDAHVVAGSIETLGGVRVGRWHLDVADGDRVAVLSRLRAAGLAIEDDAA